jgi:hypothetical protein
MGYRDRTPVQSDQASPVPLTAIPTAHANNASQNLPAASDMGFTDMHLSWL